MFLRRTKAQLITPEEALPGRPVATPVTDPHEVLGTPLTGPFPEGTEIAVFGMGCFWGAERLFWTLPGVLTTSAGYAGGYTPNPSYDEVCSGRTGHAEVVQVNYDPTKITYEDLLKVFWENHDPTQGMRQGNDMGTQYRSAIYTTTDEQLTTALASRDAFAPVVARADKGEITTEISPLGEYYLAEGHHQQYLAPTKNPGGYCNHGPTGLSFCAPSDQPAHRD
ncbi:peptide-methionine (S)-S-oxide reductase MsrA [Salinispora sp. H7-4]|uniref:peptide-methionine (S)-S-oxide reductase MsrA n=1 Tax=Salinispora sp. H7-4 TaxID=2748321 RepID=UPI0015D390E9|nr:peptide-methionine (S)-S-oxide reductase MsrA [Salinispora sp. H7-4]NYT94164.1 peptide-methionine (S)-S-oxide reductase MsrA [Salinispora sp. H7-4]